MTLKGHVKGGRLILDEPTDLPDGTEVELLLFDAGDDGLSPEERLALEAALVESEQDVQAGRLVDAEQVLRTLRSR